MNLRQYSTIVKSLMSIKKTLSKLNKELTPYNCQLIAVSKTKPASDILEAYNCGQRNFGENKAQELVKKYETLPKDIKWHMIGHLQTNKVKYIAPFIHLIHAVDSEKLLTTIDNEAKKNDRKINCLLQLHIGDEETKFGMNEDELVSVLDKVNSGQFENVNITGLMGMATNTYDKKQIKREFKGLKNLLEELKIKYSSEHLQLKELSIGMSGDYNLALKEGSTMVRIGSSIFGERSYP
ncbi:YggS family pyridoxal phosphate-dependent enzyme [Reichenbachiella sp. MALMAid0571]|uniref:YggS family pyridoxal phosphate-dependent enzyme n=1 Tax=Reichenbachiella sp. MALMAid0571 TaxID=3143939 RepID=UPI0032E0427C